MESTGSNMPMKMMPMKPAMKNSISGSANATAVFKLRSRSPSVTAAMRTSSASSLPLSSATEIISSTEPEKSALQSARLWPSRPPCCTRSMDCADGVHENLVADGTARDVQAMHQRHARAEQRAEHPAETRHRKLRDERADQRRLAKPCLPRCACLFRKQTRCAPENRCRPARRRRTIRKSAPDGSRR